MGVKSDGSYGVDAGLYYSFPVMVDPPTVAEGVGSRGTYRIVADLRCDTDTTTHIAETTRRLRAELDEALAVDDEMAPFVLDDVSAVTATVAGVV